MGDGRRWTILGAGALGLALMGAAQLMMLHDSREALRRADQQAQDDSTTVKDLRTQLNAAQKLLVEQQVVVTRMREKIAASGAVLEQGLGELQSCARREKRPLTVIQLRWTSEDCTVRRQF